MKFMRGYYVKYSDREKTDLDSIYMCTTCM